MRVLHLILTLERAGAQEVVRSLIAAHKGQGVESVVAVFIDGEVRADIEALGVPVHVLGPREHGIEVPWRFRRELKDIRRRLVALIEAERVDIVQTHLLHTLDLLAVTLPVPVIWTLHNIDYLPEGRSGWPRLKRAAHRWLYRRNRDRFAAIVSTSDAMLAAVEREIGAGDHVLAIPNGVELREKSSSEAGTGLRKELGVGDRDPLILNVGRLTEQKGQIYLVRAMRTVADEMPGARLLIAGEGELEDELTAEVRRLNLQENVFFLGLRTDIPHLLDSVQIFALPSLWEGLSIALLEAMAASLPIVATRVSGTDQVLEDGRNGLVIEPRDQGAIARGLLALLSDRSMATTLGETARQKVESEHSSDRVAEQYLRVYDRIMSS